MVIFAIPITIPGIASAPRNATRNESMLIENAPSVSDLVTENAIVGNATLSYNGTLGGTAFGISSWREVR